MRSFHHFAAANHSLKKEIDLRVQRGDHVFIVGKVFQRARMRTHLFARERADAVVEREFQRLDEVEHRSIAPAEVVAHRGELHAADDGIIPRVLVGNALALEGGNHRLVVEELRHAAALADNFRAAGQKPLARARKHAG
ncbi:hypothetical protein SDC9_84663 [bioreactor metagenome]|uniref:Uncharacterized protein n=1 Tax=bioreactor metagenome TaxID=1076179 RepID=A0A644ZAX4_9ZZZZ